MQTPRLRGLNFGGWLSQIDVMEENDPETFPGIEEHLSSFIGEVDFARQAEWGFNHVRLPIDTPIFFDEKQSPIEPRLRLLDQAVAWATHHNLFTVLDLHECPGHDFADAAESPVQQLFTDPQYVQKTVRIWSILAERYRDNCNVLFEPLNEPVAPTAQLWNEIKVPICQAVRDHAPDSTIIIGSNMWNWPSTFPELTPLDMDNIIYNFHFYEPLLFTHQHAPWMHEPEIKQDYTYPDDYGNGFIRKYDMVHSAGVWNRDRFIEDLQPVVDFGRKHGADITCNEFGVYAPVPISLQVRWLEDFLSVLREFDIGFTYWNYKNLDFGIISHNERLHAKRPQYVHSDGINHEVLSVLQKY